MVESIVRMKRLGVKNVFRTIEIQNIGKKLNATVMIFYVEAQEFSPKNMIILTYIGQTSLISSVFLSWNCCQTTSVF